MRIWLITVGEPWPIDSGGPRLLRTGVMASYFAKCGDEVVWWNALFNHVAKMPRDDTNVTVQVANNYRIMGLRARSYQRNVSLARIRHNQDLAHDFIRRASTEAKPDVIVASMPPLELARAAVRYGEASGVPVIIDIRDMWPEIWLEVAPPLLRPLARRMLFPFYRMLGEAVDKSACLIGISDPAIDWGLGFGSRKRKMWDGALPMAKEEHHAKHVDLEIAEVFWRSFDVTVDESVLNFCFFSNFSRRHEIDTIVKAADLIPAESRNNIRIVLCGQGDMSNFVQSAASRLPHLIAPGWVNAAQIDWLLAHSAAGLLPYRSTLDYARSIPNKVFDYMSGGLPIVTSLKGVTGDMLVERNAGILYENGDAADLARILCNLVENPSPLETMSKNMRQMATEFTPDVVYGKFREKLLSIVEGTTHQ